MLDLVTAELELPGPLLPIEIDGMRQQLSKDEKEGLGTMEVKSPLLREPGKGGGNDLGLDDSMARLEEERNVDQLKVYEHYLLCDRVELTPLRLAPVLVTADRT